MNMTTIFGRKLVTAVRRAAPAGLATMALLLLAGCSLPEAQPDLTRFYVLTPKAASPGDATADSGAPRVFLRSIIVPEYLRGKIMQVRLAENEVKFVDTARWAEPLEAGLARVLREDLAQSKAVEVVHRGGDARDFELVIHLRQFEGVSPAGVARLEAQIELLTTDLEPKVVALDEFSTEVAGWDGQDFGQLAAKLSEAAARLGERIVALVPDSKS